MTKADKTEMKLLLTETIAPLVTILGRHENTLEDKDTGLKGRVQRHGERINELQKFQVEVKTKMGMIGTIAGAVGSAIVLFAKSIFSK